VPGVFRSYCCIVQLRKWNSFICSIVLRSSTALLWLLITSLISALIRDDLLAHISINCFLKIQALNAATCDVKYVNGLAPECISASRTTPYCRLDVYTSGASPICAACLTDCDCDVGQYCSITPETLGTCVDFKATGRDCLPFTEAQLVDSGFNAELKW